MNRTDRLALKLAIETARRESPGRRQQIDSMLGDRPWREVAEFASTCCQGRALRLKPWEVVPCDWHPDDMDADQLRGAHAAAELRARMAKANISRWHPDPLRALEAAEAARKSTSPDVS
jgi:hypothetical protein